MSALPSTSQHVQARPRQAKAPPLTSMPSTPGLDIPGSYPRNSTVFSENQWDQQDAPGFLAAAKTYLPAVTAPIANAKAYLPPAVTSYFPLNATASTSNTTCIAAANSNPSVHTPYPMNTDGSAMGDSSDFSSIGMLPPALSDFPLPPSVAASASSGAQSQGHPSTPGVESHSSEAMEPPISDASTVVTSAPPATPPAEERRGTQLVDPGVEPLPALAPIASAPMRPNPAPPAASNSSGSASDSTTSTTTSLISTPITTSLMSTPPSSPASASSPKSPSSFIRWASRSKRPSALASKPPSAFPDPARASLDAPPTFKMTPIEDSESPKRRASLLRTLRGEVKVLSGKVRRDPARVEAGRRMMSEG